MLQKLYVERTGRLRSAVRDLLIRIAGTKTGASPAARRATERRMLALWRASGIDVPEDLTDAFPQFGGPGVALYEFVEGTTLHDLLEPGRLAGDARRDVLTRFGTAWGRRHAEALRRGEAALLQEHGSIRHAMVSEERIVTIDLEQAFLPRRDLRPLVAKEVADTLRSLWKRAGEEQFRADLAAILDGYGDPATLAAAAAEYLEPRTPGRRLLWALDRRLRRRRGGRDRTKYGPLEVLAEATAERAQRRLR